VPVRIVLGVGAGIAAYKSCELLRLFTEAGHRVRVVPTPDALRFVGEATWAALSGEPVSSGVWDDVHNVPHVRLGQTADLVFVAPATADLLARAAQANVATLRNRGAVVLDPATGRLTGPDTGPGRLPEPAELFGVAVRVLARGAEGLAADLTGRRVLVSAGGTREELDPVRFIGNWSSGRQGYAIARAAAARGAKVTLVAANVALEDPAGAQVVRVVSAHEMRDAVIAAAAEADAVVMAAAVADYRPETRSDSKIKKSGAAPPPLRLVQNPDILRELSRNRARPGQVIVGFAAETGDVLANGRAKLAAKGCDLLVVNQVGGGLAFGTSDNEAVVLAAGGGETRVPRGPKEVLAEVIWDLVASRLD
jgi:phosphopantothenoylcysteine decarboxylase/phosphopantothenate--cysteine ligase